jgi:hypothetical protein
VLSPAIAVLKKNSHLFFAFHFAAVCRKKLAAESQKPKQIGQTPASAFDLFLSSLPIPSEEIKNDGQGECMFKALSFLVYGTEKLFQEVREMIMEVVQAEKEYLKAYVVDETIADHVTRLKNPGEWGEHPELYAANLLYKRKLVIYRRDDVSGSCLHNGCLLPFWCSPIRAKLLSTA